MPFFMEHPKIPPHAYFRSVGESCQNVCLSTKHILFVLCRLEVGGEALTAITRGCAADAAAFPRVSEGSFIVVF